MNTSKDPQTQAPTYTTRVYHLDALATYEPASLAAALDPDSDSDGDINAAIIDEICANPDFPELRNFAADVEDLMERLMPDWSRAFPIVEVSLRRATRALPAADPTFAYWHPGAADLLRHAAIGSIARITLRRADVPHRFALELVSGDRAIHLHAELPTDGPRAELAYSFDDIEAESEARPLVATLNQRRNSDIALLRALEGSAARICDPHDVDRWIPAYVAGLWRIDDAVRASGLCDADPATQAAAGRLAETWLHRLEELLDAAEAVVDSSDQRR